MPQVKERRVLEKGGFLSNFPSRKFIGLFGHKQWMTSLYLSCETEYNPFPHLCITCVTNYFQSSKTLQKSHHTKSYQIIIRKKKGQISTAVSLKSLNSQLHGLLKWDTDNTATQSSEFHDTNSFSNSLLFASILCSSTEVNYGISKNIFMWQHEYFSVALEIEIWFKTFYVINAYLISHYHLLRVIPIHINYNIYNLGPINSCLNPLP